MGEQFEAVDLRHPQVGDDEIDLLAGEHIDGLPAVQGRQDGEFVLTALQTRLDALQQPGFVVDYEYALHG